MYKIVWVFFLTKYYIHVSKSFGTPVFDAYLTHHCTIGQPVCTKFFPAGFRDIFRFCLYRKDRDLKELDHVGPHH